MVVELRAREVLIILGATAYLGGYAFAGDQKRRTGAGY